MTFKLEFKTDTAAFDEDPTEEISRILWQLTGHIINSSEGSIRDVNGNVIGKYEIGSE